MAINLKKAPPAQQPAAMQQAEQPAQNSAAPAKQAAAAPGLSFLKKGKAAQAELAKVELKAEQKAKGNVQRFWLPDGAESSITFLDGDLVDGTLDIPFYYEHQMHMNGSWKNWFICTQDEEPCPICEGGHYPAYVGAMTIIDHAEYTSKKDGKVYKDQVRLLVAKKDSIKQLQKIAVKMGGLRGQRFDVSRTGDKSAAIGNTFFPVGQKTDAELLALYKEASKPLKYDEILSALYMPAKELRKLGFGSANNPVGGESGPAEHDYQGEL